MHTSDVLSATTANRGTLGLDKLVEAAPIYQVRTYRDALLIFAVRILYWEPFTQGRVTTVTYVRNASFSVPVAVVININQQSSQPAGRAGIRCQLECSKPLPMLVVVSAHLPWNLRVKWKTAKAYAYDTNLWQRGLS
jgi:hypothetical protein